MDFPTLIKWTNPFEVNVLGVVSFKIIQIVLKYILRANSTESDQTLPPTVSDLVLHCLSMFNKNDTMLNINGLS